MQKLIDAYKSNPTDKNAEKLRAYNRKHPMALCLVSHEDLELLTTIGVTSA